MKTIQPGNRVRCRNAYGDWVELVAVTGVVAGGDFAVVRVCTPDQWEARNEDEVDWLPWPAEDVEPGGMAESGKAAAR